MTMSLKTTASMRLFNIVYSVDRKLRADLVGESPPVNGKDFDEINLVW